MIDRLRQMAIFAKTIDHGSFRGAAAELNLSPSVVSHHVSELEAHLGVALIYRSTRKLTLTEVGERLLIATRNMLGAVEGELRDISGSSDSPSGQLHITVPSVLSRSAFSDAIAQFLTKYPRVNLTLDYSDTSKDLIDDGFDLAIRMWTKAKRSPNSRVLFSLRRQLVASPSFLNTQPTIDDPHRLQSCNWVSLSPVHTKGITLNNDTQQFRFKPKSRVSSNDAQSLHRLVLSGLGVAALPEFLVAEDIANKALTAVLPDWRLDTLKIFAEWPINAPRTGLIKLLVNELSAFNYKLEVS
ncbi:LysR family transcriptional regulator [Arenicella sp. 4NH20-0111]|uniref:LysR family transcriptional regulator n=1 Tax=Arenicella sp. 4NH20-0111 TaxID=3127648 RepID=UPI00333F40D9